MDAVCGEMLEPCSGTFLKVEQQVLDDKEVIVHPAYSIGEAKVFQPYGGVGVPKVLDDVRRCVAPRQEWCLPDPHRERLHLES